MRALILVSRIARDLCLIAAGILTWIDTPPSVREAGIYGVTSKVWSAMLCVGALVALYGVLSRRVSFEITGCSFVGGGFAVWCAAALSLSWTPTTVAVALVFLSGTAGQFYRVGVISSGYAPVRPRLKRSRV